ncbi:ribonuclease J [Pelagibacteraceae bacterium]|jgi:ribonuclease J|nr:ribonuclease J [Pelagibacteraceae bacterium]
MNKKEEFIFCPLGGSGEIGMNMNLFAYGNKENRKWIIVDIGVTFADDTIPGIDLIYPDPGFIVDKKSDLLGLVLTHAHEDHIGAIAHVWPKLLCNIYATPFTSVLIREKFKEKKIDLGNKLKIVELNGNLQLGQFKIEFITLTHSILEPNGLSIETPSGTVLHTGDWKIDPNPLIGEKVNEKKLKKIGEKGILAMVCDSTNVFSPGKAGSELDVRNSLLKIIESKTKRVVVTSFASNAARMESIFYCAEKTGRQISLVGRSMHRIYNAAKQCGYLNNLIKPLDPREAKKIERKKILYLCTGSQGEPNGAMMRISNYAHPDVFIEKNDTVVFSSKIIPGNEKKLYKLHNQLVKNGIDVVSEENEFVHVSGHPNREDLKEMYNWVKPKSIIPVHGEHRHMIEHINFAKEMQVPFPVQVENGDIVQLYPGTKPEIVDKAPVGRMLVDGKISIGEDSKTLKERINISYNGFLEVTIIINNSGSIVKNPIISHKGIPSNGEDSNFIFELEDKIRNICKSYSLKNFKQEQNLIDELKANCKKAVKEKTGKRPYTNVNLIRI